MDRGGQLSGDRFPVWLDTLLAPHELIERARQAARLSGGAHNVQLVCPTDLPLVRVDEERMAQVLATLINNALRLTPPGDTIIVGAMRATRCHEVIFFVQDGGPGISAAEQPFVFARRRQALPRGQASAGLGLTLCKDIVEGHGGRIYLASRLGEGATFCCALPAHHELHQDAGGVARMDAHC